jgi:tetratricopeptide (TPR) repeat protein
VTGAEGLSQALLRVGLEHHRIGDRGAAEIWLRRAVAADPREPTALYLLGLLRFEAGDDEEAIRLIEAALAVTPQHVQSWTALGNLRQWQGDNAAAADAFRCASQLEPGNAAVLTSLSQALLANGDAEAARSAGQAAAAAAANDPAPHLALAAALAKLKRPLEASEAYRTAAQHAPDSAPAHLGLAVELLELGESEMAKRSAETAVSLDDTSALGWFTLGTSLRRLLRYAPAAAALERSLELDPTRRVACMSLGLIYTELHRLDLAERHLLHAVQLDPDDQEAHSILSTLYCCIERFDLARSHALRALELDPRLPEPHQTLAWILSKEGNLDEARRHRDVAYGARNFIVAEALQPIQRVLVLATTGSGNVPERHLLPSDRFTRIFWFVEYATPGQAQTLPAYDVVFNAIGDEDETRPTANNVDAFLRTCSKRVFNPPDRIAHTRRDLAPALFGGIRNLVIPRVARIDAATLAEAGLAKAARGAGLAAPMLVRPIGSHGGENLSVLLQGANDNDMNAVAQLRCDHYATAFHDFRSADGLYRKYRMIFVDRQPYPYHLAIGNDWMVHYETSGTAQRAERLAEERRFLEDPRSVLGERAMDVICAVGQRLDLDFGGADFSLLEDGSVLLFEANATMLVHPEAVDGPLGHKNRYVERILAAFWGMLGASHRASP